MPTTPFDWLRCTNSYEVLGGGDEPVRRATTPAPLSPPTLEEDRMVEGEVEDERARRLAPAAVALGQRRKLGDPFDSS